MKCERERDADSKWIAFNSNEHNYKELNDIYGNELIE